MAHRERFLYSETTLIRTPAAHCGLAMLLAGCGMSNEQPPGGASGPLNQFTLNAPWHAELGPCAPEVSALGVQSHRPGDVDGDGMGDVVLAICGGGLQGDCAMQLCLSAAGGRSLLATSWMGTSPELVRPLPSKAVPWRFEAFHQAGDCILSREFAWSRGDGYLQTTAERCDCPRAPDSAAARCGRE